MDTFPYTWYLQAGLANTTFARKNDKHSSTETMMFLENNFAIPAEKLLKN